MIPPRSRHYRDALAAPHEAYSRVEVWRDGIQVEELAWRDRSSNPFSLAMPVFLGGDVRATLGSQVTRTMSIEVPRSLYPRAPGDLLAPYGNELRAFRGIRYGDGSEDEFPIFVGPITRARPPSRSSVTVEAKDRSFLVAGAGFASPVASQVGDLVLDEFERLVLDVVPNAIFGAHSPLTERVPVLAYDGSRGASLDSLAKTANAFWYALAGGQYVVRRVPWTVVPTTGPIVLVDGPGGTLRDAYPDRSADGLYNQIPVVSERVDGGPAFSAFAEDTNPASPTYVGGPFGRRCAPVFRVTGAVNQGQLLSLAQQILARTRTLIESWSISCVPDGSLELGDPLDVTFQGDQAIQLIAGYGMPLDPNGVMTIDGRSVNPLALEDS